MSKYSANRSSHLLSDNSWIKRDDDEDEDIDRDPNFAKTVLGQRSETTVGSSDSEEIKTTTITTTRSVQDLTKRFSASQEELTRSSTLPSSKTSSYTRSTYSSLKSDSPTSTRTTTVSKDGTITETTYTTSQSLKSPVLKSPPLTETFSERVRSSSKGSQYTSYSPSKTTQVTETVTSGQDAVDNLYDTLLPSSIRGDYSTADRKTTVSTTETVIMKSTSDAETEEKLYSSLTSLSPKSDYSATDSSSTTVSQIKNGIKTTTTTRTSSSAEDDLYGTLLPKAITSASSQSSPVSSSITKREIITLESSRGGESPTLSSPSSIRRTSSYSSYTDDLPSSRTTSYSISTLPSDEYGSDRRSYSYSKPDSSYDYTSTTITSSPSNYSSSKSYRTSSRSDDVYSTSERTLLEKDLCTSCHRPFTGEAKMVLDDMKINCHASCFKCEVCNSTLGHMKAGDSMWIYKRMVHCENCFEVTRDKWRC